MSSSEYKFDADAKVKPPEMFYYTKTVHHEAYDRISPFRPELSAGGKNIVVTGGGSGIGQAIAIAFAQAGAKSVSILGRREDRLKSSVEDVKKAATNATTTVLYKAVDLQKREDVVKAFQEIGKEVGNLDILVSNAGAMNSFTLIADFDVDEFMQCFDINVRTALNAVQAFLPLATSSPTIISISTAVAHFAPMPAAGSYAVSKAANLKMMDYLAAENPHIHLVNVQPGTVATEMAMANGVHGPDKADLAGCFCVWLASPEARFLKSKMVWVNWDVDELMAKRDEIQQTRLFTWLLDGVPM